MKLDKMMQKMSLVIASWLVMSLATFAQEATPTPPEPPQSTKSETPEIAKTEKKSSENNQTNRVVATTPEKKDDVNSSQSAIEEAEIKEAIVSQYTNYLSRYELGPEDIISVQVFGQPNYSKAGITIPPTATIQYPLIPGGIFVGGKTLDQIEKEIAKKLDEYIIDPQVTVTLEKVGSAQFAVLGKVGAPGVRLMTRRYSVYDAIVESGGLTPGADKKRITLLRRTAQGSYLSSNVKLDEMIAGKIPMEYLTPGDQLVIPEKKWSLSKILEVVNKASAFRVLFGSPF